MTLTTERLVVRQWQDTDYEPWAALNCDPIVMAHFPAPFTRNQADTFVAWAADHIERLGWGLWAVEVVATGEFVGMAGIMQVTFKAPFVPAVEIGWRLAHSAWGNGYATEAARGVLGYAFGPLGLGEVVSFTTTTNERSQRVMQRLGMVHDPDGDFDHPRVPDGHHLRRHVLYRISAAQWSG